MTPYPWPDALIILGLVVLNALFSMTELAIVSARPARLKVAAEGGSSGAKLALELAADPGKLLSTAQIGITLIGIIAGAYSGASLGGPTGERLAALGVPAEWAETAGFMLVIQRWHQHNCRVHKDEVEHLLDIARNDHTH